MDQRQRNHAARQAQLITTFLEECEQQQVKDLALEIRRDIRVRRGGEDGELTDDAEGSDGDVNLMQGFVQVLFELVPALRSAREGYCFERCRKEEDDGE